MGLVKSSACLFLFVHDLYVLRPNRIRSLNINAIGLHFSVNLRRRNLHLEVQECLYRIVAIITDLDRLINVTCIVSNDLILVVAYVAEHYL